MIPRIVSVTRVEKWSEGEVHPMEDYLVDEESLEIRVAK